jgi:hypothetical protein
MFGKTHELETADNKIITLGIKKWLMKHHEHHPLVKFGLKCFLIPSLTKRQGECVDDQIWQG